MCKHLRPVRIVPEVDIRRTGAQTTPSTHACVQLSNLVASGCASHTMLALLKPIAHYASEIPMSYRESIPNG